MREKSKKQGFLVQRDYSICEWNINKLILESGKSISVVVGLSYFFYRSMWAILPMTIVGFLFFRKRQKEFMEERKRLLMIQFKECILSVSASLKAGYSIENAFCESITDMQMLFGDKADICMELSQIKRGMRLNVTLEELLYDLGKRSQIEEIIEFAEVFSIAKRRGGNMPEVIWHASELIRQKVETEEEIQVLLTARKLEQKVMNMMPFGILFYIELSNKGYFDDLYHDITGIVIMTSCLLIYVTAYILAGKMIERSAMSG